MTPANDLILTLRRNPGFSIPDTGPDQDVLAAFSRAGASDPELELDDPGLRMPRHAQPGSPRASGGLCVVFDVPRAPIPAPVQPDTGSRESGSMPLALHAWNAPQELVAYAARASNVGRRARRALAVAAVTIPLSLSAMPALAFAPPGAVDPGAPAATTPATPGSTDAPASDTEPAPGPSMETGSMGFPTTPEPVAETGEELSPDLIWNSVTGENVQLTLADGATVRAKVLGHEGSLLVLGRANDGLVVSLPKDRVARIQIDYARDRLPRAARGTGGPMPPDGVGMLVGGSLLTIAASPVLVTGLAIVAFSPGFAMAFLIPGLAGIGGGIPLLVIGSKRRKAYKGWIRRHAVAGSFVPTPNGWSGGLSLRF